MPADVVISGKDDTGAATWVEVDPATNGLCVLDYPHHAIHEGKAFSASYAFSLASSGTGYVEMIVAAARYPHIRLISAEADSEKWWLYLIEAPTITDGSTAVTFANRNRNSSKTSSITAYSNPTSVSGGTTLMTHYLGGGTGNGQSKSGGSGAEQDEYVLKPSTKYVLKATNSGSGAGICNVRLFFYDHDA